MEAIELDDSDIELIIEDNNNKYCWCCGYPSDDLFDMRLEDARRKKHDVILCSVCLDSPWILDSWLNPWLYNPDTIKILETISFVSNKILDEIKEK